MHRIIPCALVALFLVFATDLRAQEKVKDYVCGMEVAVADTTLRAETKGVTFFFCSAEHQAEFKKSPNRVFDAASKDYPTWVDPLFGHYFAIRAELAGDRKEGVAVHAAALAAGAGQAGRLMPPMDAARRQRFQVALAALKKAAAGFPAPDQADIKAYRASFKPLSDALIQYMRQVELQEKSPRTAFLFHCGMANASWIQETDQAGNPYFGEAMLKCGDPVAWDKDGTKTDPKKGKGGHGGHEGHGGG